MLQKIAALIICSGLLFVVISLIFAVFAIPSIFWPSVQGKVTATKVERSGFGAKTPSYTPRIYYEYTVSSKKFNGHRRSIMDITYNKATYAQTVIDAFPVGTVIDVYYSPNNPERSVLKPGISDGVLAAFCSGSGLALLGCLFYFLINTFLLKSNDTPVSDPKSSVLRP